MEFSYRVTNKKIREIERFTKFLLDKEIPHSFIAGAARSTPLMYNGFTVYIKDEDFDKFQIKKSFPKLFS